MEAGDDCFLGLPASSWVNNEIQTSVRKASDHPRTLASFTLAVSARGGFAAFFARAALIALTIVRLHWPAPECRKFQHWGARGLSSRLIPRLD
jgi:hypothetical protein